MQFQYAQPSQVPLPADVFAVLNQSTLICVCFDLQTAQAIAATNSVYTIAGGSLID